MAMAEYGQRSERAWNKLTAKLRDARLAAQALEAKRERDARSAPGFYDNIDTSGGPDACHPWRGDRSWNHPEPDATRYERGVFQYDGCNSRFHTRVLCFATFGQEPPLDMDVIPLCGDHLCSNIRHMCIGPHGGHLNHKLGLAVPVEEFFKCNPV